MSVPLDPRLFSAPQQGAGQPYYLPSPTQHQSPQLAQNATPASALDPALAHTSPSAPGVDHDEEDHDDDGDLDG